MSGGIKRRRSKWDEKDSDTLPEDSYDRATPPRPREPSSPGRASRRHDSRSRESAIILDREGNGTRISPKLEERRPRHSSRSPRNGWGRSHRISRSRSQSRSRSRSRSPGHHFGREPPTNDRSRSRSGASGQICRDFIAGTCRRGNSCHFLHEDDQLHDNRRHLERDSPDEREGRHRRTGSSRHSPDEIKDNAIKAEKSANICNEFLKGRCRRGDTCRYAHHDSSTPEFKKGPVEEVYRNRDHEHRSRDVRNTNTDADNHDHRSRDTYPHRTHESDHPRRLCKFFAAGNCRNGTHCRFSHQVQEVSSPERSRDDKRDRDYKSEGSHGYDGPRWSNATTVSTIPTVPGWENDNNDTKEVNTLRVQEEGDRVWVDGPNEITEVANVATEARPKYDSSGHNVLIKPTWDLTTNTISKCQVQDKEEPLQWKTENNIAITDLSTPRGVDTFSVDMETSPRDIKQPIIFNPTYHGPRGIKQPITGLSTPKGMDTFSVDIETSPRDIKQPIIFNPTSQIPSISNAAFTVPQGQDIFQPDENANFNPIPNITPPIQSHSSLLSYPVQGDGMQEVSHYSSSIPENRAVDGSHVGSLDLSTPALGSTTHSTASNEQLAQLSHLTASLTQLLENTQQRSQLSSAISPHGMPIHPDLEAPAPPVSEAMIQPNQAPEVLNLYDPVSKINEPKMSNLGDEHLSSVEQKSAISEIHEISNLNQQEHVEAVKNEENGKVVEPKAPENRASRDVDPDDGPDDNKKLKDMKGIRPFKFALVEFVKELLKPSWKDGQVSKEAYKTIVKKAVDKVMETLGPQIPQTKEKIDMYLSCSKPKIDKLVQAYVGKHQKG